MLTEPTYIFDFDSTLIAIESLEALAAIALQDKPDRVARLKAMQVITDQGMAGEISFQDSLRRRLELFQANSSHVETLLQQLPTELTASVAANRTWFRDNAERIYIITGGFEDYIVPIAGLLSIPPSRVFGNKFLYDQHGEIVGYEESRLLAQSHGKARQLQALAVLGRVIVIGDGHTDYEMKAEGAADEFWAFVENINRPSVTEKADRILTSFVDIMAPIV